MEIHIVTAGETAYSIARQYGIPLSQLTVDNGLVEPYRLAVGQALVVQFPNQIHTVGPGDTVTGIARRYGLSVRQLYRNNPVLGGEPVLYPGQTIVITYTGDRTSTLSVNGYAYPYINKELLRSTIPYLTYLTPFTYGITTQGGLVNLNDRVLIAMAQDGGTAPLMHLSTLTEEGGFSNDLAHLVLTDMTVQNNLIDNVERQLAERGYRGLDVDFEFVFPQDALAYAQFIGNLAQRLNPLGYPVIAALAPKTSADQPGLLYQGHNYKAIGAAANEVLLMTYEWGYTYGPPMAVAPLPNVRRVVDYALTEIPAEKIWLGVPNYGYDWPLPYVQGQTRATSISSQQAVARAVRYGAEIQYDNYAQSPWFRYTDEDGSRHEVWFEDARSIKAKLALIPEYGLLGAGYWNLMRNFPQNWRVLNALYVIRDP
ncbi:Spore germination protein YaaH [uncultured Eubacteriales bacterium]|uniref:Spore germination protein YaaH n=1 Tax=uncultured Eubacteriales bacterium TaxID=172733 RepID=A0A212JWZ6_9FIRM|nr:Spore germination protein YaaH [uncultured Eubacteriales bacterium]